MPLTLAAQRVQVSASPDAYARWKQPANAVVGSVQGIMCGPGAGPAPPGQRVVLPGNPRFKCGADSPIIPTRMLSYTLDERTVTGHLGANIGFYRYST